MELGSKVTINEISVNGTVIGVWHTLYGQTRYNVRYYDTTKRQAEVRFIADELTPVE